MSNHAEKIKNIINEDKRYKLEAYIIVLDAIDFLQKKQRIKKSIKGQEIAYTIKHIMNLRYGVMAREVLEYWGVKCTDDFGEIVYNLIDAGLLRKNKDDRKDDFRNLYSFSNFNETNLNVKSLNPILSNSLGIKTNLKKDF